MGGCYKHSADLCHGSSPAASNASPTGLMRLHSRVVTHHWQCKQFTLHLLMRVHYILSGRGPRQRTVRAKLLFLVMAPMILTYKAASHPFLSPLSSLLSNRYIASLITTSMDPLSITTAASSLVGAIFTASRYVHDFIDDTKEVDARVKDLASSIDSLLTILQAMKNVFDSPNSQPVLMGTDNNVGILLGAVKTSIDDCMDTTKEVQEIFESIKREKGDSRSFFAKGMRQFKLNNKQEDIDKVNARILTHKTNMQLSLQTINVWVTAKAWQLYVS